MEQAPNPVLDALRAASSALDAVPGRSLWTLTDDGVTAVLDEARALAARAEAAALSAVAEAVARDLPNRAGASSPTSWLRHRARLRGRDAHRWVKLAAALERGFNATAARLRAGGVNLEQAAVIVAAVDALDGAGTADRDRAEAHLLGYTNEFDAGGLARLGARLVEVIDPDGADAELGRRLEESERAAARREVLDLHRDDDGGCRLVGRFGPESTALLDTVFGSLMRPRADGDETGERRSASQRRAEALVELCRRAHHADELPDHGGVRPLVVVTIDVDRLRREQGCAQFDTGQTISEGAARRWACDASVLPVVLDGASRPVDVGRARRLFTGSVRRALILRDRGCAFPGCDRPPAWCDGHHLRHWVDGGPTSLANAVLLCGHHHRVIHHGDWTGRLAADGVPEFRPPPWIDPQQRWRRHARFRS